MPGRDKVEGVTDQQSLERALAPVASALAADGYELTARFEEDALAVRIAAGPAACEDCLVPKSLMARMIVSALTDAGVPAGQVDLTYPND